MFIGINKNILESEAVPFTNEETIDGVSSGEGTSCVLCMRVILGW